MLATFFDESNVEDCSVYRAVCVGVSAIDCKVHFIDFGNTLSMPLQHIWKLPQQFILESVCSLVDVRLKSGKQMKNIDVEATLDEFAAVDTFDASIEHLDGNKYATITIDDSLIIFNA